ncbi:MAG: RsmB/NOP family class I SAM-dependent RNA methyltransferase [Maritimibacter sp.]
MATNGAQDGVRPRKVVVDLLTDVVEEKRLLSEVLTRRVAPLDPEDRARVQRLALAVLRFADRADRMLGPHLKKRPPERVLNILRLGVVEICDAGAPAHGVVNAAVDIARKGKKTQGFAGMINAVLRKVDEDKEKWETLPVPRLPKWLRKPLVDDYGKQVVAAMEAAHAKGAPLDVSVKTDREAVRSALGGTLLPTGTVRLAEAGRVTGLAGYQDGTWWIQDAAAAMPAMVLGAKPGEKILDLCAAPGGKTMQLCAAGADVTAVDVSAGRLKRLEENLDRCGLRAEVITADALEYEGGPFDAILLDAPCTATGTIRRHPDLPFAKDGSDFPGLFELQEHLIDRGLGLLKPGGRLVYCTCSLLIDEGEEQVRDALARHEGLVVAPEALHLPGIDAAWISDEGLRLRPDYWAELGHMDGFFITNLIKPS